MRAEGAAPISAIIPTYRREAVLVDTVRALLSLTPGPGEIIIVDQTESHLPATDEALAQWQAAGKIVWIRLPRPSITKAMNTGLQAARFDTVLFLDDDIIPGRELIAAHLDAHLDQCEIVAGQVLQPGEHPDSDANAPFSFRSSHRRWIDQFMGGNASIKRAFAIRIGGFDENFVHVAYRFEAEFSERALRAGARILFEPRAVIHHLKAASGGTRAFGHHLTTVRPSHAVGAYYYLLVSTQKRRFHQLAARPLRAIRTRYHLFHPWGIPGTLVSELLGLAWAVTLVLRGQRLIMPAEGLQKDKHA